MVDRRGFGDAVLDQRIDSIGAVLEHPPSEAPDVLAAHLVDRVRAGNSVEEAWLLYIALFGSFPTSNSLIVFTARVAAGAEVAELLADQRLAWDATASRIRIVHSGIVLDSSLGDAAPDSVEARIVRHAIPRVIAAHPEVVEASWPSGSAGLHPANPVDNDELLVPWRSTIVLPGVPSRANTARYSAAAEYSGNTLLAVGHDLHVAADGALVGDTESERVAHYISVIKHAARVLPIDATVAGQYRGLALALPAQGLSAFGVQTVPIPDDVPRQSRGGRRKSYVLCNVDVAPGENREGVIFAAEQLSSQGVSFKLVMASSEPFTVRRRAAALLNRRHIRYVFGLTPTARSRWESEALFSVFVPTVQSAIPPWSHPVVRSLAVGRPVITSHSGRTAELATRGGCLAVDPFDDDALVDAMRSLLTDSDALGELERAVPASSDHDWRRYAELLWDALIQGVDHQ